MDKMFKVVTVAFVGSLLSACGGGASSSENNAAPAVPSSPISYHFSASVIDVNNCGAHEVNADVELLVHDENFAIVQRITANEKGELAFTSEQQNTTVSFVFDTQTQETNRLDIISYIDYPVRAMGELKRQVYNDANCQCAAPEIALSVPNRASDNFRVNLNVPFTHSRVLYSPDNAILQGVSVCRAMGTPWPTVAGLSKFTEPDEAWGFVIEDADFFALESVSVAANIKVSKVTYTVENPATYTEGIWTQFNTQLDDQTQLSDGEYFALIDNAKTYQAIAEAMDLATDEQSGELKSATHWSHSESVQDTAEHIDFSLSSLTTQDLVEAIEHSGNAFDFTETEVNDISWVSQSYKTTQNRYVQWQVYGPVAGQAKDISSLDLSQYLENNDQIIIDERVQSNLTLVGTETINGYQEFISINPSLFDNKNLVQGLNDYKKVAVLLKK